MINDFERTRPFDGFYEGAKVLVTGGMGFVGAHIVRRLVGLGANVTILDLDCSNQRLSMINDRRERIRARVTMAECDVGRIEDLRCLFSTERFDVIFHLAAYSVIERSALHPIDTIHTNALGIVNIMEALRSLNHKPAAIVLASTDKVYGEMDTTEYNESSPLRGIGLYDAAKLAGDVFARTYHEVFGLPTVVLRLCNLFGPHDYNTDFRLIPKALTHIFGVAEPIAPILYFDSLSHWRDYLYVEDAAHAFLQVAASERCHGDVFNISATAHAATPEILKTVVEMSAEYEALFDRDRAKKIVANGISVAVRANNVGVLTISRQHLDGSKIREAVGFEPQVRFADGIQRTIEFYRAHYLGSGR